MTDVFPPNRFSLNILKINSFFFSNVVGRSTGVPWDYDQMVHLPLPAGRVEEDSGPWPETSLHAARHSVPLHSTGHDATIPSSYAH